MAALLYTMSALSASNSLLPGNPMRYLEYGRYYPVLCYLQGYLCGLHLWQSHKH